MHSAAVSKCACYRFESLLAAYLDKAVYTGGGPQYVNVWDSMQNSLKDEIPVMENSSCQNMMYVISHALLMVEKMPSTTLEKLGEA